MNNFDSFYFMHIQKTGGRWFEKNISPYLSAKIKQPFTELKKNDTRVNNKSNHVGWYDQIKENTYVATLIRDPAKLLVSMYAHNMTLGEDGYVKDDKQEVSRKNFLQYVHDGKVFLNFQARNFITNVYDKEYGFNTNKIDLDILNERLYRTNLMMRTESITGKHNEILKKIHDDFNIDITIHKEEVIQAGLKNIYSEDVWSQLSQEDIDLLHEKNQIDLMIYRNDRLFFNP